MLMFNTDMRRRVTVAESGLCPRRALAIRTTYVPAARWIEYRPLAFVRTRCTLVPRTKLMRTPAAGEVQDVPGRHIGEVGPRRTEPWSPLLTTEALDTAGVRAKITRPASNTRRPVCFIRPIFPEDGSMTPPVRKERVNVVESGRTQTGKTTPARLERDAALRGHSGTPAQASVAARSGSFVSPLGRNQVRFRPGPSR